MKILVHDYAGHPFQVQLSRALAARGHEVIHAFATALQTPRGELAPKVDDPRGFRIRPVAMDPAYSRYKYSFRRRRRMENEYGRRVANLVDQERPDAILSSNTPTEAQGAIVRAARGTGAGFFPWVQDFYSLAVEKLLRKRLPVLGRLIGAYYRWLDRRQFAASAGIVAITEDFVPIMIREFGVDRKRVSVVPNWAPIEALPLRPKRNGWSLANDLADKFVFLYTGTLGMKHNPRLLLDLAQRYRDDDNVRVVVISEGLGADWLRVEAARARLPNVVQLGYQPFAMMAEVLATGDVLIGVLEEDAGVFSVPSKILSYLCAQRPILLSAPAVNLATRTITTQGAGLTVAPDETAGFVAAAEKLRSQRDLAGQMGRRGRRYAQRTFQIGPITDRFENILAAAVAQKADPPAAGTWVAKGDVETPSFAPAPVKQPNYSSTP